MIKRNTVQRAVVLDAVRRLQCHATADDIYAEVIKSCPSVSRATVYRNLQLLSQLGEIRRLEIPGSPDRYDHLVTDHYHARCTLCGRIMDIEMDCQPDFTKAVKDAHGFLLTGQDIIFNGICPECRKKHPD